MNNRISLLESLENFYNKENRDRISLDYKENVSNVKRLHMILMDGIDQNQSIINNKKNINVIIDSNKTYDSLFKKLKDDKKCQIIHDIYINIDNNGLESRSIIIVEYDEFDFEINTNWE